PGVRAIVFEGRGASTGGRVRTPAVWDEGFVEAYMEPLIRVLAKTFDGNPRVWYIKPGFGHIGNMAAQPSKDGGRAYLQAGFTPEKWCAYCRRAMVVYRNYFTKTPLLNVSTSKLLRDRKQQNYQEDVAALLQEFGNQGAAAVHLDL